MQIIYLGHSGFLLETEQAFYLFDYIRGRLPKMDSPKPLYILASHSHGDHFSTEIFAPEICKRAEKYFLSEDILEEYKKSIPEWIEKNVARIEWVSPYACYKVGHAAVKTLKSTDLGVAFLIQEDEGASIYHAGDLNWWHWEGEEDPWNPDMEKAYRKEIDQVRNMVFDVAFVPLDPRLEDAYWYGLEYFIRQTDTKHVFPMHFWGDYEIIPRYLKEHPLMDEKNTKIHVIKQEGEHYEI